MFLLLCLAGLTIFQGDIEQWEKEREREREKERETERDRDRDSDTDRDHDLYVCWLFSLIYLRIGDLCHLQNIVFDYV